MKAQTTLEYLILIAAVVAVAAIVLMFGFSIFGGQSDTVVIANCRNAADSCKLNLQLYSGTYNCSSLCTSNCLSRDGKDVLIKKVTNCEPATVELFDGSACGYCMVGNKAPIIPR